MASMEKIKILQWNICGARGRSHHIRAAAGIEGIDIFLLKLGNNEFTLAGYQTFLLPSAEGQGGLATLIKNTIPATRIEDPPDCGDGTEVLGVRVKPCTVIWLYIMSTLDQELTS